MPHTQASCITQTVAGLSLTKVRKFKIAFVSRLLLIVLVLLASSALQVAAQNADGDGTEDAEGVDLYYQVLKGGSNSPFTVTLNGTSVNGPGAVSCQSIPELLKTGTRLMVHQTYQMTVGPGICSIHISLGTRMPGYKIYVNDIQTTQIDTNGQPSTTWNIRVERGCNCEGNLANPGGDNSGVKTGSVIWEAGLGKISDGRLSDPLSIREKYLTARVYTPAALVYSPPGFTNEVDVIYLNPADHSQGLRQIKAPETLADIVVISANEYDIKFYSPANVGAKTGGLYPVTGLPYLTWKFKNPNPPSTNQLQVSKTQNGTTDTSTYTWDGATSTWTLSKNGGAWVETKTTTIDGVTGDRTETKVVKDNLSVVSAKTAQTYHLFPWGESVIKEVTDPDGAALTTTYAYYQNSAEPDKYGSLQSKTMPDGSWEKYDYGYQGYLTQVMRPWKDKDMATADYWTSRTTNYWTTYLYTYHLNETHGYEYATSTEERINGQLVERRIVQKRTVDDSINGASTIPYAVAEQETVYSSASSLGATTITTTYDPLEPAELAWLANRVASVQYPDGRQDTYTYEKGNFVVNADPSLSQFTQNDLGLAERQTVIHGTTNSPDGVINKTTKDVSVTDQYGRSVYQESYVYTGSSYDRVSWSAMTYNDRGQLTQTKRSNGTTSTTVWTGDQKTSETDEAGVQTDYTYDVYNRVKTVTKKGVAANGSFPAQADIVTTNNYDTAGRIKSQVVTGGALSLTTSKSYDVAGRVSSQTDAAGLITGYGYTNGGRTTTVTMPGGATQITDSYLDGGQKSLTGTAPIPVNYDYGVNSDGTRWTTEFVGPLGLTSPRWTKTAVDWMGQTIKVEKPTFTSNILAQSSVYNDKGQLISESVGYGSTKLTADKLYEYDNLGRQVRSGLDVDGSGNLALTSTDRISESDSYFEKIGSDWFGTSISKTYLIDSSAAATVSTSKTRLNNFPLVGSDQTISETLSIDSVGNQTGAKSTIDRAAKKTTNTTDTPDSATNAVSISVNSLPQSSAPSTPQTATTFTYDSLGRQKTVVSPSAGTMTKNYDATTGQLTSESQGSNTTSYAYYSSSSPSAGRLSVQTNPNSKKVYFNYDLLGHLLQTWGDATYPLEYVYDTYGQQTELHTFRLGSGWTGTSWPTASTGTADITKWTYQDKTGLLTQKQDAALKGAIYTYDELGRVARRTWARLFNGAALTATYAYDAKTGEMTGIDYSDTTPDVTFGYDRGGRQTAASDAAGVHARTFNDAGEMLSDQMTSGILDGVKVQPGYDTLWRRNSLQTFYNATALTSQTYGYDTSGRLQTVMSGAQTATYAYYPTTGQLNTTTFTGGTNTARAYDSLGRLQAITNTPSGGGATSFTYTYNNLNQRIKTTREDGSYWSYLYNDRGELTSGKKYWSDATLVAGQQNEYVYDNLGNRTSTKAGGDSAGANQRSATYTPNNLNQYASRTNPGAVDVTGTAATGATVTVNNQAVYRKGNYFQLALSVNNASAPIYQQIMAVGAKTASGINGEDTVSDQTGNVYVPAATETYAYDLDGNLLSDGRWQYGWDAENRLISMTAITAAPIAAKKRLEFAYDFVSRRIQKKIYNWNAGNSSYQLASVTKFINDGWNSVAELDANNTLVKSYVWSGGQLLLVKEGSNSYYAGYDGNENVTSLVKASIGQVSANYEYDSFGQTIQATGDYATKNPFRFSSKYWDAETNLIYYGYRYYNSQTARWLGRDPSEEAGGINLYGFLNNDSINATDYLGLWKRFGRWTGNWKNYNALAISEKGDCLPKLAEMITGNGEDWKKLGIKGPDISEGKRVDVRKLLEYMEISLREETAEQSQFFGGRFPTAPDDYIRKDNGELDTDSEGQPRLPDVEVMVGLTPSQQVDRFFGNEHPWAGCRAGGEIVLKNALKNFLKNNSLYDKLDSSIYLFANKNGKVGDMLKGDMGNIPNYDDYSKYAGYDYTWQAENSILISNPSETRTYWGHGVGKVTQYQLAMKLASAYSSASGRESSYPSFNNDTMIDITFLNVSGIAQRIFDINKNRR